MSQENHNPYIETARKHDVEAPAYMATRVVAHYHERQRKKRLWIWQSVSALSLGLCAIMAVLLFQQPQSGFSAEVFSPQVVKVEVDKLMPGESVEAEIILPDSVAFYSPSYPELAEERSLRLDVNAKGDKEFVPFVVQGEEVGSRKIKVQFFNKENKMVLEKTIEIDFRTAGTEG